MCEQCGSVLVPPEELEQLLNETSPDDLRPLAERLFPRTGMPRICARCPIAMTMWTLYDVEIDRCPEHGLWFDRDELGTILQANSAAYAQRPNGTIRPAFGVIPFGIGVIVHSILAPWLDRRRLRKHIARTSPPKK